jgi:RNA polymerase sigma-70 factor, ECF subfamily
MNTIPMSHAEREKAADDTTEGVSRLRQEHAFRSMVIEHAASLRRVLRSLGVREADVDDICQETFIVAHRQLPTFEGRSSVRTWLCGIALRVASEYRRKAYRRREVPTDVFPRSAQAAEQDHALEQKRAWLLLESLLAGLTRDQREVFVLYELAELSVPEAAKLLGCAQQTAYSRLKVAREYVQRRMAQLRAKERTP